MKQLGLTTLSRSVVSPALAVAERTGDPAAAMELPDGTILTGKTSELLGCFLRPAPQRPEIPGGHPRRDPAHRPLGD